MAVQPEELRQKLGRIAEIMQDLPSPQEAEQTLNRAGAVYAPEQIGISQDLLEAVRQAFAVCPLPPDADAVKTYAVGRIKRVLIYQSMNYKQR